MGDRANVVIKDGDEAVCLYTHWNGTALPEVLRKAMTRGQQRWDDSSYLARIIFCDMVEGKERELTGFGSNADKLLGAHRVRDELPGGNPEHNQGSLLEELQNNLLITHAVCVCVPLVAQQEAA